MAQISEHLTREPDSLRFTLNDTNTKLTFTLHYQQYEQRYGIYRKFIPNGTVIEERLPRAKTTITDTACLIRAVFFALFPYYPDKTIA